MSVASLKSGLSAAYAKGEAPTFERLLPGGTDELWRLADVALVLPVVPVDASAELEYCLRLRRDTLISGTCPDCGAVPSIEESGLPTEVPLGAAVFHHRFSCAANDKRSLQLLREHRAQAAGKDLEARLSAASRRTRIVIEGIEANGTPMEHSASAELALGLLDERIDRNSARICPHLDEDPAQPWSCLIATGEWKCDQCWAYHRVALANGSAQLDPVEELTCDLCRRFAPTSLEPLVLRINHWVMYGGACGRCRKQYSKEQ